jgi:hypothetical protein
MNIIDATNTATTFLRKTLTPESLPAPHYISLIAGMEEATSVDFQFNDEADVRKWAAAFGATVVDAQHGNHRNVSFSHGDLHCYAVSYAS